MSTATLLPQTFWFRVALPCRKVETIPSGAKAGPLLDLPESCLLPDFRELDGLASWARVRAGWNAKGLGLSLNVERIPKGSAGAGLWSGEPDTFDVWIDTRDTRDVHRATRFCHHFRTAVVPAGNGKSAFVRVEQRPIHRAVGGPPIARPETLTTRYEATRTGWRLDLFLPATALNGFDPETNRRLGFSYRVSDARLGEQFLTVGRDFPVGEDPSLWAVLELSEGPA